MKRLKKKYSFSTFLVHGREKTEKWEYTHHVVPPITASTTFRLDSVKRGAKGFEQFAQPKRIGQAISPIYIYDRLDEPTVGMLEEQMATIEEGDIGVCFASGMAAINAALLTSVRSGEEILAHKTLYGCTYSLLTNWYPRLKIKTNFVNLNNLSEVKKNINNNTQVIYLETPANPTLEIIHIGALRKLISPINKKRERKKKILIIVDNTFATPFCQRPLTLGADIVLHSLTKNISGFGTEMGGIVIAPRSFYKALKGYRKDFGGVLHPRSAWSIMVNGLATLSLRIKKQQENALKIAQFLTAHSKVAYVSYPGLASHPQYNLAQEQMKDSEGNFAPGNMIYFEIKASAKEALRKCEIIGDYIAKNSYAITLAVSLGQLKTLFEAPGPMTHSSFSEEALKEAGIHPAGLRMSIGIEEPVDIIRDLEKALKKI